ncbi:MAG: esterase family protein [Vicinamibacterales bacterium]
MVRDYHRWFSPGLDRDMELLVFGHSGDSVLVFPTREGRFYDYEDWGLVRALEPQVENGRLTLYCVDSLDSDALYSRSRPPRGRIERAAQYERYILDEVVPFVRSRDSTAPLVAHGCSIGAYHAVTVAFRHPECFRKVVGLSGRYDLTRPAGSFPDLFDGYYDEDIYFHTPSHFLPNLADASVLCRLRGLDITLAVGEADVFCEGTKHLSGALWQKDIPHRLDLWPGEAHRARDWRAMVQAYL